MRTTYLTIPRLAVTWLACWLLLFLFAAEVHAQTTAFTFQGRLNDAGAPATGNYDLELRLFTAATVGQGTQIDATLTKASVPVKSGVFTVELDFGANAFPGADRFLQVAVKPAGSGNSFNVLNPRQPITPAPYAIHSVHALTANSASNATNASHATNASNATNATNAANAGHATKADNATNATNATNANNAATATNATQLGGQPASNYVQTNDARLTDARPPTPGSANYIQNNATATSQPGNFRISGDGTAGGILSATFVNAATQFLIGGSPVLTARKANTFVGVSAGTNVTVNSNNNTLIGFGANTANFDMDNATAIGANALVEQPNALVLGSIGTRVGIGTTTPQASLDVRGNVFIANNVGTGFNVFPLAPLDVRGNVFIGVTQGNVPNATNAIFLGNDGGTDSNSFRLDADHNNLFIIGHSNPGSSAGAGIIFKTAVAQGGEVDTLSIEPNGHVKFPSLGAGDTTTALCRNSLGEIAFCGSSSLRYKSEVATFLGGLEIINRLRPISFLWNQSGTKDIGFGAEEVEKVEPLFTFKNDSGETEGVRYDRLGVLFVNAFKEEQEQIQTQQAQIDAQQERIRQQEERLEKLEKVLSGKSR